MLLIMMPSTMPVHSVLDDPRRDLIHTILVVTYSDEKTTFLPLLRRRRDPMIKHRVHEQRYAMNSSRTCP